MPKLVRARGKSPDDIPEWAKCCWVQAGDWSSDVIVVDMSRATEADVICGVCRKVLGQEIAVPAITGRRAGGLPISIVYLDLEEGPMGSANA